MPRTISLHPLPVDKGYTERSGRSIYCTCAQHAHVRPSHTCTVVCNSPTHSLIPLIRSHFRSPWVRPRPFWCHLPLTRRTFTLPGEVVHVCACAHRQSDRHTHTYTHPDICTQARAHTVSAERCSKSRRGWTKESTREEEVAEEMAEGRDGRAYSGIQRAAGGRR